MADRPSVFAGTWRPEGRTQTGHSAEELSKRASFDQAPASGASCAVTLPVALAVSGGMWWALYEGGTALIGAIA